MISILKPVVEADGLSPELGGADRRVILGVENLVVGDTSMRMTPAAP